MGLKDVLATFDRLGIEAHIHSKFCNVSFDRSEKHDFSDVITLHACISDSSDPAFVGTEFILKGCSAEDIEKAKRLFLSPGAFLQSAWRTYSNLTADPNFVLRARPTRALIYSFATWTRTVGEIEPSSGPDNVTYFTRSRRGTNTISR